MSSKTERMGLAAMLCVIAFLQAVNTPFLMDKGWLIIIIVIVFNVGAYTYINAED